MDVMHPSSFRETEPESQLLNLLLVGTIEMTKMISLPIKTFADDSLNICQREIYMLARGFYGLLRMVQAKAPLNF